MAIVRDPNNLFLVLIQAAPRLHVGARPTMQTRVVLAFLILAFRGRGSRRTIVRRSPTILDRVTDYVVRYQQEISGVVAEEHYVQDSDKSERPYVTHRELRSDLLLVRESLTDGAVERLRAVSGRVRGRRRARARSKRSSAEAVLYPAGESAAKRQAAAIMNESARYNIGRVERNVNVPCS